VLVVCRQRHHTGSGNTAERVRRGDETVAGVIDVSRRVAKRIGRADHIADGVVGKDGDIAKRIRNFVRLPVES